MLLYYHSWMFYNHFIVILYHFLLLTYWHSAKCHLWFSACFLHRRKSISKGVQTQRNFLRIFGPEDIQWARKAPGGAPRGAQPTRARLASRRVLVSCAHLGLPLRYFFGPLYVLWSQKIHKKFRCVWNPFGIDFLQCKKHAKKQQLAHGTMSIG